MQSEDVLDPQGIIFGRTEPANIPESGAWWRRRQADLRAMSEPFERGTFAGMMTITQNDAAPELLAHARRGPCALPTADEMVEHLLIHRSAKSDVRPNMTLHPEAATLSFQRRTHAIKRSFLRHNRRTLIGVCIEYWDRAEEQMRKAKHFHILFW